MFCGWITDNPQAREHNRPTSMRGDWEAYDLVNGKLVLQSSAVLDHYQTKDLTVIVVGSPNGVVTDGSSVAESLAYGYQKDGTTVFRNLANGFAIVTLDRGTVHLVTDKIGKFPIYYAKLEDGFAFSDSPRYLMTMAGVTPQLCRQSIYDYLFFHVVPGPATAFVDVRRVLPAYRVSYSANKVVEEQYWAPDYSEQAKDIDAYVEDFRDLLRESVRKRLGRAATGAFLSGGTDSSTVTGVMSEVMGAGSKPKVFSIGFDAPGFDETNYARIAAERFQLEHVKYDVTPEDLELAIPHIASCYGEPFGNASAVPTYYCAKLAKDHGVDCLLSGDGGDELFAGNERYAKQMLFDKYTNAPPLLRNMLFDPLAAIGRTNLWPFTKVASYVNQARTPLPDRLQSYNQLLRFGPEDVLEQDFLARVDPEGPFRLLREQFHAAKADNDLNRMLASDLRFTLYDNDLVKVTQMCLSANVEVRYPLLDDDLVAFSARLPADMKLRPGKLRYFFKYALRDFLPVEILTKPKHGFGLPFGLWLVEHKQLNELARTKIDSLGERGILNKNFLRRLMDQDLLQHPNYIGGFVWVLLMLEEWIASYEREDIALLVV